MEEEEHTVDVMEMFLYSVAELGQDIGEGIVVHPAAAATVGHQRGDQLHAALLGGLPHVEDIRHRVAAGDGKVLQHHGLVHIGIALGYKAANQNSHGISPSCL